VPSTLLHPEFPYLQGLLLFALLAAFMWGERIPRADRGAVVGLCALAGLGALIIGPSLDQHRAWVDYESFAGQLAPSNVDTFNWSQTYGPINWPRRGRTVMDVAGRTSSYWKAQNLDVFDGREWTTGSAGPRDTAFLGVDPSARAQWTQTLQVTIRTMKIATILAAGTASAPQHVPSAVFPGSSPGTWVATNALAPGDSYSVDVYDPRPGPGQLARAGDAYPSALDGYRTLELPSSNGFGPRVAVQFPTFHSGAPIETQFFSNESGAAAVSQSPYASTYALAHRLAGASSTPYGFVESVLTYLGRGYTYSETPPRSSYPLASFLLQSKVGYCQQFAGATALMLRMGGIPARVAAGFTSGTYDASQHQWAVTDVDAHAWVEAWFPHYGWVRFDPTPAADPALGGRVPITSTSALGAATPLPPRINLPSQTNAPAAKHAAGGSGGPSALLLIGLVAAGLAGAVLLLAAWRAGQGRGTDQLVSELERALSRSGRPMAGGMTLAGLERRVRGRPEAEEYIRALRLSRFGSGGPAPTLRQRRALRAELRSGLGLAGAVRALWALPPRWQPPHRLSGARRGP
jgi:transglutaminase-like putative cysteine protease